MRRKFTYLILAVALCGLPTAAAAQDPKSMKDEAVRKTQVAGKVNRADQKFVMDAAKDGMAEVKLGRMALERASHERVKTFAQRMIDDHTKANNELTQLATSKGITLPADSTMHSATPDTGAVKDVTPETSGQEPSRQPTPQNPAPTETSKDKNQTSTQTQDMSKKKRSDKDPHMAVMHKLMGKSGADFDRAYMEHMVKDHQKAVSMFERQASRGNDPELKAWAAKTLPTLREHLQMARDIEREVKKGGADTTGQGMSKNTSQDRKPKQ